MNSFLFYQTVRLAAKLLPRRVGYAVARQAAGWGYRRNHSVREALAENLRVVLEARGVEYTESDLARLLQKNFEHFAKYVVDFFKIESLSPGALRAWIRMEPPDYLEPCRAMGKGVIGLSAHLGNWELGALVLNASGDRVNAIVREQSTRRSEALFGSRRARRGVRALPMRGAAGLASACLKRNEFVVILADLDFSGREPFVPFFGRPARLPRGPAVLSKRTGAPILPAFVLRQADDTFCFRAYPPILPGRSRSVQEIQRDICAVLEAVIGEHPEQWFAYQPLWPARSAHDGEAATFRALHESP